MIRPILIGLALAVGVSAAIAQNSSVIEQRKNLMKANVAAARPVFPMLRGQAPFALEPVQNALRTISANAKQAPSQFPDDSKTGETKALPAIWANKADFNAIFATLDQAAQAALVSIKDEASFKTEFPKVMQTCDSCHNKYQAKS